MVVRPWGADDEAPERVTKVSTTMMTRTLRRFEMMTLGRAFRTESERGGLRAWRWGMDSKGGCSYDREMLSIKGRVGRGFWID
jgi:hypothetical protein